MKYPRISIAYGDNLIKFYWYNNEEEFHNEDIFNSKENLILEITEQELMKREKERLGFNLNELVFVGTANMSKSNWCMYQYYLKSIEEELNFFGAYIKDRVFYSANLGLLKKKPNNVQELLKIGDNISLDEIETLLNNKKKPKKHEDDRDPKKLTSLELGGYYENKKAEKLKSIRWNFRYKSLILLGVPDGLALDYAYEFKYLGKERYISTTLETAQFQANFYALNYKRKKFKTQIYVKDIDKIKTKECKPSQENADWLINQWIDMINNKLPKTPNLHYVCNSCKFKDSCKLINKN